MGYFLPQKVVLRYSDGGLNRLELLLLELVLWVFCQFFVNCPALCQCCET